ncbi:MAG: glycosyltransferase family A protein, partial [Patescibacteria group bacterium]
TKKTSPKTPKVSIVIPAYNEESMIAGCLDVLIPQLKRGDEVIVVDNNSTDKTVKIAKKYKVRVLKESRQGQVFAQDTGFAAAKNEIIARIDADTFVMPEWLEAIRSSFKERDVIAATGMVLPRESYFKKGPVLITRLAYESQRLMMGSYLTFGSNCAFRKTAWKAIRNQQMMRSDIWEDVDMGILLSRRGRVHFIKEPLATISVRRLTGSPLTTYPYLFRLTKTYWLWGKKIAAVFSVLERAVLIALGVPFIMIEAMLSIVFGLFRRSR